VKRGGGVIWLAGDESAATRWRDLEGGVRAASPDAVLPAWNWRSVDNAESAAGQIKSTRGEAINAWAAIRVLRRWRFDRTQAPAESPLLPVEFSDHQPVAWAWRPWGRDGGSIAVVNVGANPEWSDAAGAGIFAAMAHSVASAVSAGGPGVHAMENVTIAESDLRSMKLRRVEASEDDAPGGNDRAQTDRVQQSAAGAGETYECWPWLLAAAIVTLVAESWAARPTEARHG
jgi:hypothetical protein